MGVVVPTANTFAAFQTYDESCSSDGSFVDAVAVDSLSCEKGRAPPIVISTDMEGMGRLLPIATSPLMSDSVAVCPVTKAVDRGGSSQAS
ncbi:hypothetical protein Nepgr_024821 [Nepenthes gracilis]|uniref:Uncharacterized protein n=1 Tax=Nepenthes gracilis TaxID=150966 RepID=A0AAD3XZ54_NEPGR|nr:hypothetical protein Nepgr_024821 [Nepenthes gracilis]